MLTRMAIDVDANLETVTAAAETVAEELDLGATSHVLMGGTAERVLSTVDSEQPQD